MPQDATPSPGPVTKLILVRHGSTKLNSSETSSECIRGWLDIPLSPDGIKEAQATAQKLAEMDFDCIISSDLDRAAHTADIISQVTGVPNIGAYRGLRPWHVGEMAGKKIDNCQEILVDHIKNKPDTVIPGGESFNQFKERCLNCLDAIRKQFSGKTVAIVTHHRNERLMQAWKDAGGGLPEDIAPDAFLEKGIPPAAFIRHTLAPAGPEPDDDADDAPNGATPPKRKPTTRPTKPARGPAKSPVVIAANTSSDQAKVFKRPPKLKDGLVKKDPFDLKPAVPIRKSKDGLVKQDPFDLKPKVPIKKTLPTWGSAIRGSILEA